MPEGLFESEFFGHVRGSFTGAFKDKAGRFELADGGTLFLDEIGEIPFAMQAKLLRVLQEQELERIGDIRTRKVNVRVIAATNRDLTMEVDEGRFRQDLFYRLRVFPIEVPPLRERREDIAPLAAHFIRQSAKRMNRSEPKITQAALAELISYDWPGNVRQLQNVIERSMILWQGGPLTFDLPIWRSTDDSYKAARLRQMLSFGNSRERNLSSGQNDPAAPRVQRTSEMLRFTETRLVPTAGSVTGPERQPKRFRWHVVRGAPDPARRGLVARCRICLVRQRGSAAKKASIGPSALAEKSSN